MSEQFSWNEPRRRREERFDARDVRFADSLTRTGGAPAVGLRPQGGFVMADIGYALLLIGGFVVLLLVLRGLQRL